MEMRIVSDFFRSIFCIRYVSKKNLFSVLMHKSQGSVLGLKLFILYINDIFDVSKLFQVYLICR